MTIETEPQGAVFVEDRSHRLYLWRRWISQGDWVMFIGLNPSTADETRDDPTVRRCIGFARNWGFAGMFMCNAFTLVSTDPAVVSRSAQPVARGATLSMKQLRKRSRLAVAAWGNLIMKVRGGVDRADLLRSEMAPLHSFGLTGQGHPRHPLYLPYSAELRALSPQSCKCSPCGQGAKRESRAAGPAEVTWREVEVSRLSGEAAV